MQDLSSPGERASLAKRLPCLSLLRSLAERLAAELSFVFSFISSNLAPNSDKLSIPHLDVDLVKRTRRRPIKHFTGLCVESALVARAFKTVVFLRIMDRTRQMSAFLPKRGVAAVLCPDEDGCLVLIWIMKIQRRTWLAARPHRR